jgi:hypothetical protein
MAMSTAQNGAPGLSSVGSDVMDGRRTILARGENMRHIRHADILRRWPILPEEWARAVESARLAAVDRTPGTATFGR